MAHEDLDRFLGWRQVRELTGLGRTTAWRLRRAGDFPEPVPISPGRVAWRERDIVVWNETRGEATGLNIATAVPSAAPRPISLRPTEPRAAVRPSAPDPQPTAQSAASKARKPPRRTRSTVVEGQLGFDF
ncbi:AlpA family phage regulatory protein [Brevundimonas sp.]|uniref:helix-turn-helix transcriptional regulator n=1 Tax=Brevundimonas sp. TaxID=1871086 RepID=UPI00257D1716|nr:AlpA family phage regulatory protein [Brevundimonas sp.]